MKSGIEDRKLRHVPQEVGDYAILRAAGLPTGASTVATIVVEIIGLAEFNRIDTNEDGRVSSSEHEVYARRIQAIECGAQCGLDAASRLHEIAIPAIVGIAAAKFHHVGERLSFFFNAHNDFFEEVAKFGEASVRRIYGDFSGPQLKSWSDILQKHAIDPYQQFAYTKGKNASDIALVIDAMDLLHSGRFDGFCLVSSDSDFTRLASRLREQGADVYGFGTQQPGTRALRASFSSNDAFYFGIVPILAHRQTATLLAGRITVDRTVDEYYRAAAEVAR